MSFNPSKLAEIAQPRSKEEIRDAKFRKENRAWLKLSQQIALAIHYYLRISGMTQRQLAQRLDVTPVYVNKLLKGGENLTLESIARIQQAIDQEIISIARPYAAFATAKPSLTPRFSDDNAVKSNKFSNQPSPDVYISASINVA